jgi:hypothetical protein
MGGANQGGFVYHGSMPSTSGSVSGIITPPGIFISISYGVIFIFACKFMLHF